MPSTKQKAFTLAELIVVIVILTILATIAFLSFTSQSASARDSTRLADMNNIAKGLGIFNAVTDKYPLPDSPISITASGASIGSQGYAGSTVLGIIKLFNGGKDPLDSEYYTYSTNLAQNKYQILGFLEDGSNSVISFLPLHAFGREGRSGGYAYADTSSYTGRYVLTKGDQLGILLSSTTLVPAQSSNIGIDVKNTTGSYIVQFTNKDSVIGTGSAISIVKNTMKTGGSKFPGCADYDIAIGNQVWASCNSTLGEGSEWGYTYTGATGSIGAGDGCWDYTGVLTLANCAIGSTSMASNAKEKSWSVASGVTGASDSIWGKLYTWKQASLKNNACINGWHLPSDEEWTILENYLKGTTCAGPTFMRDGVNATGNGWGCSGLGWMNNSLANDSNNLIQALKLPLSGRLSTNGSTFSYRGYYTSLWTNTTNSSTGTFNRYIYFNMDSVNRSSINNLAGASVRCIKD